MYVLTLFYRNVQPFKVYGDDPEVLRQDAEQTQAKDLLKAWRVVQVENGKCFDYWKEGENANEPAYQL